MKPPMTFETIFRLKAPLSGRRYLSWGIALFALKYLVDSRVASAVLGWKWHWTYYFQWTTQSALFGPSAVGKFATPRQPTIRMGGYAVGRDAISFSRNLLNTATPTDDQLECNLVPCILHTFFECCFFSIVCALFRTSG